LPQHVIGRFFHKFYEIGFILSMAILRNIKKQISGLLLMKEKDHRFRLICVNQQFKFIKQYRNPVLMMEGV
jgi:hypothetical protein